MYELLVYVYQLIQHAVSKFRFVFPALGGLLFGYDIGATSGATISLQVKTCQSVSVNCISFLLEQ